MGSVASIEVNNRHPYSFGQTGVVHTHKGGLLNEVNESMRSPPESMGATNQYTFM